MSCSSYNIYNLITLLIAHLSFFRFLRMKTLLTSRKKITTSLILVSSFLLLLFQYLHIDGWMSKKHFATKPLTSQSSRHYTDVCKQIVDGNSSVIKKANSSMSHFVKQPISPWKYIDLTKNCNYFAKNRGYILKALSKNEEDFPIAFSINIYKDVEQFERLLRAIYRPQNFYCIHVDKKSPSIFRRAVKKISSCFSNVFVASEIIKVVWGESSILQSQLICMKDLWKRSNTWKYLINLTGQEFPLKTNNELVDILQKLKGKSIVKGRYASKQRLRGRYLYVHRGIMRTNELKQPFPGNFTFYKGSTYVVLSKAFVNFILHDKLARDFLEWVNNTGKPEETFYQTLYFNVDFDKYFRNNTFNGPNTRYVNWSGHRAPCHGKFVRHVCVHGIGDLKTITQQKALFVNKFYLHYQYLALDCIEQWLHKRTLDYYGSLSLQ